MRPQTADFTAFLILARHLLYIYSENKSCALTTHCFHTFLIAFMCQSVYPSNRPGILPAIGHGLSGITSQMVRQSPSYPGCGRHRFQTKNVQIVLSVRFLLSLILAGYFQDPFIQGSIAALFAFISDHFFYSMFITDDGNTFSGPGDRSV